jgi:hypothetical protein
LSGDDANTAASGSAAESYDLDEDATLTVAAPGVLAGDSLNAVIVTPPHHFNNEDTWRDGWRV